MRNLLVKLACIQLILFCIVAFEFAVVYRVACMYAILQRFYDAVSDLHSNATKAMVKCIFCFQNGRFCLRTWPDHVLKLCAKPQD